MEFTIMTVNGIPGPSWICDDAYEAEALAAEHGYDVLDIVFERMDKSTVVVA